MSPGDGSREPWVAAIDLGTTGCRAAVYDAGGRVLGAHYLEYGLQHPEPGAAEQDPREWWAAAATCVREAVRQAGTGHVGGLGVSAQGHSWVPVGRDLEPLRPALTWLDTRATETARVLLDAHGAAFWGRQAGKLPGPWHLLAQLLWLRQRDSWVEADQYLFAHDYLMARLTGRAVTDLTTAAGSLLLNLETGTWDEALAARWGVEAGRLAPLQEAGMAAGHLTAEAAGELGLPEGVPVAVGAQDQKCAALAAGLEPGVATVSLGTSTAITALVERPSFDLEAAIPCFPYLRRGQWVLEAPLVTTGGAYRWLRDLLRGAGARDLDFAGLDALAAQSRPGAGGVRFAPYLAGAGSPHWDPTARGSLSGLNLETTAGDVARAVLEGVAREIGANLEAMARQGVEVRRLRLFGGGVRSVLWAGIIGEVTGVEVERLEEVEAACRGAAILGDAVAPDAAGTQLSE